MNVARWSSATVEPEDAKAQREVARATRFRQAAAASLVLSWTALFAFAIYPFLIPVFLGLSVASLGAVVYASRRVRRYAEEAWAHDARAIDEFRHERSWLVEIIVRQSEAPTGADRGMLWIEDGRLYFNGSRTSFGLAPGQATGECQVTMPVPGIRHGIDLSLRQFGSPSTSLSIAPVVPAKWQGRDAPNELRAAIDAWVRTEEAFEGQGPPVEIGPAVTSERCLLMGAILASGYWVIAGGAFLYVGLSGASLLAFPLGTLGLLVGLFGTPFRLPGLRWRAWRDRRRLERAQWKT